MANVPSTAMLEAAEPNVLPCLRRERDDTEAKVVVVVFETALASRVALHSP